MDIDSGPSLVFGHNARPLHGVAALSGQLRGTAVKVIAHVAWKDRLVPLALRCINCSRSVKGACINTLQADVPRHLLLGVCSILHV